jgi:hypothetical protein
MMAALADGNVQQLIHLFHGTFHAQPQTRMQAEIELNKASGEFFLLFINTYAFCRFLERLGFYR